MTEEELLHKIKKVRNTLQRVKRSRASWIGHILHGNCLLKHVIEGKVEGRIEGTRRQGRRRRQLLDELKEKER